MGAVPALTVSRASAGFIQRGHPWIRPDRYTHGLDRLQTGQPCLLVDERGIGLAGALADPQAPVCARVYTTRSDRPFDPAAAMARAWEARRALHTDPATDCYRLVHGEADGLPGLRVERYGDRLSAIVTAACIQPHLDAVLGELARRMPGMAITVHEHLDDLRVGGVRSRAWPSGGPAPADDAASARELGVSYVLQPAAGIASGLYVDQRENRRWLRARARGQRVLNLFAYTGAFSMALLAGGAESAVDVDLSGPALERAAATARANGFADRHRTVRSDARSFCRDATDRFGIVVIDPPTSAQGGGGWVARRDYPELIASAWNLVAPGGLLLATCNQIGKPYPLAEAVSRACPGGRPADPPGPGADIPQLRGFPEGLPFRCTAVQRR